MVIPYEFINNIIEKYKTNDAVTIHITDEEAVILISSEEQCIGIISDSAKQALSIQKPVILDNGETASNLGLLNRVEYCTPYLFQGKQSGIIVVMGDKELVFAIGNSVKAAIEAAYEYIRFHQLMVYDKDSKTLIGYELLSPTMDLQSIISKMNKLELDPDLLRTVIYLKLTFHQNKYFNINLNLGYRSSIEKARGNILALVQKCLYLNGQDLCFAYDNDSIVIIKSFIPTKDIHRVYLALDVICRNIAESLVDISSLSFHIAYGNVYGDIANIETSYQEALEIMEMGQKVNSAVHFYQINDLLFDSICQFLHPQIVNKIIKPLLDKIIKKDGSLYSDVIDCAEIFVDNGMNYSLTAEVSRLHRSTINSRLEKLELLTGLEPASRFSDAFLVKLLAVYIRQQQLTCYPGDVTDGKTRGGKDVEHK